MDSIETRIAVLEVRVESTEAQNKRLIAHVESEQRNTQANSKRIDALEKTMDRTQKQVDAHELMLLHATNGINIRVDRLERAFEQVTESIEYIKTQLTESKAHAVDKFRWNINTIVNLAMMLSTLAMTVLMFLNGKA